MTQNHQTMQQPQATATLALAGNHPPFHLTSVPACYDTHYYIYDVIEGPNDFVDIISILDNSQEGDIVNIHLCTEGGNLFAAIVLVQAIQRTQARVIMHADGEVSSAGTIIFHAAKEYVVNPYALFMYHDGSTGMMQKLNEIARSIDANRSLLNRLAHDLYSPILDADEIEDIMEGRDKYITAYEMIDRINNAAEKQQQLLNEEEEEMVQEEME